MDLATLGLSVESRGMQQAARDMRKLGQESRQLERHSSAALDAIDNNIRSITSGIAGLAAGLSAGALFRASIANTIEQERVLAQLNATLRSTGNYTPTVSEALQDYAAQLQAVTTYGDETIIGAQAMLLTFTKIGGETFPRATEAILDLSTAMGSSLKEATVQVGKALNDPVAGLSALSESGIQFTAVQKDLVKQLVETNQVSKAQTLILDELETQFGGSARAAKDTLGGSIQSLKNSFGDLLEGDSGGDGVRGATQAINDLTKTLNDPNVKRGFQTVVTGALDTVSALAKATAQVGNFATGVGEFFGRLAVGEGSNVVDRVTHQLGDARAELARLQDELSRPRLLRMNPFAGTDDIRADIERQAAEVRRLVALRDSLASMSATQPPAAPPIIELGGGGGGTGDTGGGSAVVDQYNKTREAIERQIAAMQLEADTYGRTRREAELMRLEREGAIGTELRQADSILATIEAMEAKAKAEQENKRIVDQLTRDVSAIEMALQTEEERIRSSYERRRSMILDYTERTGIARVDLMRRLEEEFQAEMFQLNAGYWDRWLAGAGDAFTNMDERAGAMLDSMTQRFGDTFESMIFDSDNAGDAMRNMFVGIGRQAANTLGQMGAQWLVYKAVQSMVGKNSKSVLGDMFATQKGFAQGNVALSSYDAIAKAWASAPFPANLPAVAITTAQTGALQAAVGGVALAGMAHDGIDSIPQQGTWLLDRGERVVDRRTNGDLKEFLAGGGAGGNVQVDINSKAVFQRSDFEEAASDWLDSSEGARAVITVLEREGYGKG